jgi:hypothetical protein
MVTIDLWSCVTGFARGPSSQLSLAANSTFATCVVTCSSECGPQLCGLVYYLDMTGPAVL